MPISPSILDKVGTNQFQNFKMFKTLRHSKIRHSKINHF